MSAHKTDLFNDADVISTYTQEQALEDGILVKVGHCGRYPVVFTANLFNDGYEDDERRIELVTRGIEMLSKPDPEDTDYMRLRVVEKNKIWAILDDSGITLMKPEDY